MRDPHYSDSVRKVTIVERNDRGEARPVIVYKKRGGRERRVSSRNRPLDDFLWNMAQAQRTFADSYIGRHRRSNRKERDGAVRDFFENVTVAFFKGLKRLT